MSPDPTPAGISETQINGIPPTRARVDLDALAHNVRALCEHVGAGVSLIAVLKANAYGHGAPQVARAAVESGAARLAVARVDEGVELRRTGVGAPVHLLSYSHPAEAETVIRHDLRPTLTTVEGARALSARAEALGREAVAHIKIDTGMGRYGLRPEEAVLFMQQIAGLPGLRVEGVFTHFAAADGNAADRAFTEQQGRRFEAALQALAGAGFTFELRHAANSAATLAMPHLHFDAVRVGIAMYGLYPSDQVAQPIALRPVMSLHSHVARVWDVAPGDSLGYGRTFTASQPMRAALVPVGYGDGFHRLLSNRGSVLIRGQRAPLAGRVSMDQITVDVSGIEGVQQDDDVVLLGSQGEQTITADEIARHAETINYEVVTALSARVPRVFVRGGQVIEVVRLTDC